MKWTFKQIEPMSARGTFKPSMLAHPEWVSEEKYDGDRRVAQFCTGNKVRFTSKRVSDVDGLFVEKTANLPHLSASMWVDQEEKTLRRDLKLLKRVEGLVGTVLDGEIVLISDEPGDAESTEGRSKFVTRIMGSKPDLAIEKQWRTGWLTYVVFDCLFYKGRDLRDLPYWRRRDDARNVVEAWNNPFVKLAEQSGEIDVGYTPKKHVEAILKRGGEGIILKHRDGLYGHDSTWVKKKFEATYDVVVMGYENPKATSKKTDGKVSVTRLAAKGWIGAIKVGQYRDGKLWECGTVRGFDDALCEELSTNGGAYIGKVIEVKANGREPTGRFRHPRFKRWRPDKAAKKCTYRENES